MELDQEPPCGSATAEQFATAENGISTTGSRALGRKRSGSGMRDTPLKRSCVRSRKWTFTTNNPPPDEEKYLEGIVQDPETGICPGAVQSVIGFLIFGRETGDSGNYHLQGYLETTKKISFSTLKKLFPRSHLEKAKYEEYAYNYCKKEGNWVEFGVRQMAQGKRSDLLAVQEALIAGATEMDLWTDHFAPMVRYNNSFRAYRLLLLGQQERAAPTVSLLWGKTGTGKTREVWEREEVANLWNWGGDRWFDGYIGQEAVLFDDFDGSQIHFRQLLRLLDRYPLNVPIKGGFVPWIPKRIYLTSNSNIESWFPLEDIAPLARRLTEVKHFE